MSDDILLSAALLIAGGGAMYVAGYIGGRAAGIEAYYQHLQARLLGDTIDGNALDRGAMHYIEQAGGLDRGEGRCPCCCHCKDNAANYEPKWSGSVVTSASDDSRITYEVRDING